MFLTLKTFTMKKYNLLYMMFFLLVGLSACKNDKEDYYIGDIKSNERAILGMTVKNSVGAPAVTLNSDTSLVKVTVFGQSSDLKTIAPEFTLSYGATISPASGTPTDFTANPDHAVTYTVTSQSGQQRKWTVVVDLFNNPYEGSWAINSFTFDWDDGNGWGNSGEAAVASKFPATASGLDDIIAFGPLTGVNSAGAVYGSYERTAGTDGLFASYVNTSTGTDWTNKFGQLPAGKGNYYINSDNTVTVVVNGKSFSSKGASASDGSVMTYLLDPAPFSPGSINWGDYYGNNDNKACVATKIWYVLKKQ